MYTLSLALKSSGICKWRAFSKLTFSLQRIRSWRYQLAPNQHDAAATPPEQGGDLAEELAYRLRQQQLTAEFGLFALKSRCADALLQETTRICADGMQARLCKVMAFQADQQDFLMVAGVGWKPGYVGHARTAGDLDLPTGYAFQTQQAVISNHLQGEARFRTPKILEDHGVKRAINVVIFIDSEPYGILEVDSPLEGRFTPADLAFMQGFANLLGVALDRQRVEDALRISEEALREAVEHQNVLIQEVSHRVKNSLAIVASLLQMQSRSSTIPEVQRALTDAETRVLTIAQLHDRLWRTEDERRLNLKEFLTDLCKKLNEMGLVDVLTCDVPAVMISTDDAIPLGLLINELITNALKYASPHKLGDLCISMLSSDAGLRLEVRDHGPGLPLDLDAEQSKSLGMKLIARLSHQLGGTPQWHNAQPGTLFVLEFSA
jgi:two-component sensor histidine kinase